MRIINEDLNNQLKLTDEDVISLKDREGKYTLADIEDFDIITTSAAKYIGSPKDKIVSIDNQENNEILSKLLDYVLSFDKVTFEKDADASDFYTGYETPIGRFIFDTEEGGFWALWYDPDKLKI